MSEKIIDSVYLHIGNGGFSFNVSNEKGPTINIAATHFTHTTNTIKLHVNKQVLKDLGNMFLNAAEYNEYTELDCCAIEKTNK